MIKLTRPHAVPASLVSGSTLGLILSMLKNAKRGRYPSKFRSDIYGASDVKESLRTAQHDKCCFCESKITHISYGDIEHFRPKAGYCDLQGTMIKPGYFWLAYDWSNLMLSCTLCNQRHKRNYFPLIGGQRCCNVDSKIELEVPAFVNPYAEEPSSCITFREEYVVGTDKELRGKITVETLGLNRTELVEVRRTSLQRMRLLRQAYDSLTNTSLQTPEHIQLISKLKAQLSMSERNEYFSMMKCAKVPL